MPRPLWLHRNFPEVLQIFTAFPSELVKSGVILMPETGISSYLFRDNRIIESRVRRSVVGDIIEFVTNPDNIRLWTCPAVTEGPFKDLHPELVELKAGLAQHQQVINALVDETRSISGRLDRTAARQAEEEDGRKNELTEDRIVIHGVTRGVTAQNRDARGAEAVKIIDGIFRTLFKEETFNIVRGMAFSSARPIYEVTMESVDQSRHLRSIFGKLPIDDRKATKLRLTSSVTPATRVRISILKVRFLTFELF